LTKALYVKDDRAVAKYLAVTIAVSLTFTALLLIGLYAHVMGIPADKFLDPTTGVFRQDLVMMVYLGETFPPAILAVITVALLAAGMSTLDGILVALSSIASNDIFLNLTRDNLLKDKDDKARGRIAYWVSQGILVALGVASFFIALDPPKLLGIFGQVGVYGIVAASAAPILFGILVPEGYRKLAFAAALAGPVVHFALYAWGDWATKNKVNLVEQAQGNPLMGLVFDTTAPQLGLANPGVTATYGLIVSALIVLPALVMHYAKPKQA
jgi:SSS family solute:Na+ symporter/sodium/pantothenate symporter